MGLKSFLVAVGVALILVVLTQVFNATPEAAMGMLLAFGIMWGLIYLVMEFGRDI